MGVKSIKWKDYHHQIYQIYHGIIAITLIPFALLFLEWDSSLDKDEASMTNPLFIVITQLIWIVGYGCWYVWKGRGVQYNLTEDMNLEEKMLEFKRKNLKKYLILAIGGILTAGAMWVQPSFLFVITYFAVLVQYSFLRPSEDKFVRDMRVTKMERKMLHGET